MRKSSALGVVLVAMSSTLHAACLEEVSNFAERICGQIDKVGSRVVIEGNGELKAEVSGIIRKVLGNAGGTAKGKILQDAYENVLREDLAKELFNVRECRVKMVEVGRKEACKPTTSYRSCRHPDFGRAGWERSEVISQSSGWRGGGGNPDNWCNELISSYVVTRALGTNYEASVLETAEESDRDWMGHVTYNYHCKVEISSIPVYAERTDPRCGIAGR
jgi:hypothetical protein